MIPTLLVCCKNCKLTLELNYLLASRSNEFPRCLLHLLPLPVDDALPVPFHPPRRINFSYVNARHNPA